MNKTDFGYKSNWNNDLGIFITYLMSFHEYTCLPIICQTLGTPEN